MEARVNQTNIFYIDEGSHEQFPVIFIHAFPMSHMMWQPQTDFLNKKFRVIAYDVCGFGGSEVGSGQFTMETCADDLVALMDHLGLKKAVWCGLSMGGYIALRAIEKFPDRCRGLVLCDTRSEADGNEGKLKRAAAITTIQKLGATAFVDGFLQSVFLPESIAQGKDFVAQTKKIILANSPLGICGALLAMGMRTDTTDALRGIAVPTLVVVGENDALTPVAMAQNLHERIRNSRLAVIPNAAHMCNLENPGEFNRHLLEFLENTPSY